MMPEKNPYTPNTLQKATALGLSAFAIASYAEAAYPAQALMTSTETTASGEVASNPLRVAAKLIEEMNYNPESVYPNVAYSGALLIKEGTFLNNAPIASAERAKVTIPGTSRVKVNETYIIQFPRIVYYDDTTWAIGFKMPLNRAPASAIRVGSMRWINLETARYDALGYPSLNNPQAFLRPRLLPVYADSEYDLQLTKPANIHPQVMPNVLQLMTKFENKRALDASLNYMGLKKIPDRFKPRIASPRQ